MNRRLRILIGALAFAAASAQAVFPIYTERQGKYPRYNTYDTKLPAVWTGWKTRFLVNGLVQGNDPSGAKKTISEGQSYGMLLSLWMGDQTTFDQVWQATETNFWTGSWYRWTGGDNNYAGDADIDIAGALIFASALVDSGKWTNSTVGGNTYKAKAKIVLQSVITNFIDKGNNYRINSWPGAGDAIRNPSYHMPGWYPIFKEFAAANGITGMDWDAAAKGAFDLIEAQPNSQYGMARNFSSGTGGSPGGGTSSPNNYDMGFDAIRVPYRMAIAAMWYPTQLPRAVNWCMNVWKNGSTTKGVDMAMPGEYTVSGPTLAGWTDNKYEWFMTRALWGGTAVVVSDTSPAAAAAATRMGQDFGRSLNGNDYLAGEEATCSSTLATSPCLNYYAQSLGLLGGLVMGGRAWNVWDDMKHTWTPVDTTLKLTTPLSLTPSTVNLVGTAITSDAISVIGAKFNRAGAWHLYMKGQTSGATFDTAATLATVNISWNSLRRSVGSTKKFVAEKVDVRLIYAGVDTVNSTAAKATLTVNPNTGILSRPVRGEGSVRWADGGILLQDQVWQAGDRVRAQILDFDGRTLAVGESNVLVPASNGLLLRLPATRAMRVRILELTDLVSKERRQYVLSPNP